MDRFFGYQESFFQHRVPLRPELIVETDVTRAQVNEAMAQLLALPKPPTALFAFNDVVAYAVLDHCQQNGVRVPDDLSLVTFDYQALVQREMPRITGVVVPVYEVGRVSAELLLNRFNNPDIPFQHVALPYTFAHRDTTGQPKTASS